MTSSDSDKDIYQYARGEVPFKNYVIAVLDTPEAANEAADALQAEGFAPANVVLSAPLRPNIPKSERKQGTLADQPSTAERWFSEEGFDHEVYTQERRSGHVVIQVRTDNRTDVERAHDTLVAHHAHTIKRVGRWTRENLPDV